MSLNFTNVGLGSAPSSGGLFSSGGFGNLGSGNKGFGQQGNSTNSELSMPNFSSESTTTAAATNTTTGTSLNQSGGTGTFGLQNKPTTTGMFNFGNNSGFGGGTTSTLGATSTSNINTNATTSGNWNGNSTINTGGSGNDRLGYMNSSIVTGIGGEHSKSVNGVNAPALNSQNAYFDHLLERSKQRMLKRDVNINSAQLGELPSLQLGLGDIAQRVRCIGTNGATLDNGRSDELLDSKAHYLLAASGVPTAATVQNLDEISTRVTAHMNGGGVNESDINVDAYIQSINAQTTLNIISEGLAQSKRDFELLLQGTLEEDWDGARKRVYEHFGLCKVEDNDSAVHEKGMGWSGMKSCSGKGFKFNGRKSVLGQSNGSSTILRRSGRYGLGKLEDSASQGWSGDSAMLRDKQEKYGECVQELTISRLQEVWYKLLDGFLDVEKLIKTDDNELIIDSFKVLMKIIGPVDKMGGTCTGERIYATEYLRENGGSEEMRARILKGSRQALEEKFLRHIQGTIERNLREAHMGGIPSAINEVRGYIRVCSARKELGSDDVLLQRVGEDYVWVLIYYLLRCGLVNDAAEYISQNHRAILGIDRSFPRIFAHYAQDPERSLPRNSRLELIREWETQKKYPTDQVDPYRMACYKIIGRIELERRSLPNINLGYEDWVWLQFALARESRNSHDIDHPDATSRYDLEAIRQTVLDIGERHFTRHGDTIDSPSTYFHLLISAGLFEQAVNWLYDFNAVTAIHFAIALDFYGLLRVGDFHQPDLLNIDTDGAANINFGLMIGHYTCDFRIANPELAVDYLTLICLNSDLPGKAGELQVQLCHEALRELVLETREFSLLLGDILNDGQRIPGAIEQRLKLIKLSDHESFLKVITLQAASVAEDCGRITDAVILYHLASEYDSVINLLNSTLLEVISTEIGSQSLKLETLDHEDQSAQYGELNSTLSLTAIEDPVELSDRFYQLFLQKVQIQRQVNPKIWEIFGTLLLLAQARNKLHEQLYHEALDVSLLACQYMYTSLLTLLYPPKLIAKTGLLPFTAHGDITMIRSAATNFNAQPAELARVIGPLLLITITAFSHERTRLRSAVYVDDTKSMKLSEINTAANDLIVFAGLVRYRLEARVFETLSRAASEWDAN